MKDNDQFPRPATQMCLWYYRGDLGHTPRVAIVTSFGDRTGLNLSIFEDGKRELTLVSGTRHKDDPFLLAHPTHAKECGCWDYLPGQDPRERLVVSVHEDKAEDVRLALENGEDVATLSDVTVLSGGAPVRRGPGRPRINQEV